MAINRLVGSDSELRSGTLGPALITGSATKAAWYKIVAKSGDTVFPAGYKVGDLIQGATSMTFSATNSASLVTFTTVADASSFSLELSADEIEVTVLADSTKHYRKGKTDVSGTIEGISFLSSMRLAGSVINKFVRTVTGDTAGNSASVMNDIDNTSLFMQGMLQKDDTIGETIAFVIAEVELFNYSLGAAVGDAQSWSSGIRVIGSDPVVFMLDSELAT